MDECDDLAHRYDVKSMPFTIFLRSRKNEAPAVLEKIEGGGAVFLEEFKKKLAIVMTPKEKRLQKSYEENIAGEKRAQILANMSLDRVGVTELATKPIMKCFQFVETLSRMQLGMEVVNPTLSFDLSAHEAAKTAPAILVRRDLCIIAELFLPCPSLTLTLDICQSAIGSGSLQERCRRVRPTSQHHQSAEDHPLGRRGCTGLL